MAVAAIRGLAYLALMSGLVVQRTLTRQPLTWQPRPFMRSYLRGVAVALTAVLTIATIYHRWLERSPEIGGTQPGLGRSAGDWPDTAIAALKADPPPGRMMNIPWSIAND